MNKKLQPLMLVMSLFIVFSFVFGGNAGAITLDSQGNYQLGGYLQNITGLRLEDGVNESGDLSTFRNELFLDFSARFSDELQFNAIARGHYEGSYGLDSGIHQRPDGESTTPGPDTLDHVNDFDFREYYLTYSPGNFIIKIGRQQVAWGEADAIRIADIINPLDLSWRWSFPTWEEIRIPLHMINLAYNIPDSARDVRFEVVYVPADFRPHQFAPEHANWSLWDNFGINADISFLGIPGVNSVHDL
ncbi:MAG: hypothetical protein JRH15_10090, partial [Deltaproteobacteria bacterium]|nr:hypothetical protein [Deltaproteobacteria bacterium]